MDYWNVAIAAAVAIEAWKFEPEEKHMKTKIRRELYWNETSYTNFTKKRMKIRVKLQKKLTKAENNIDYYVIMLHIYTHYTAYKHLLIFRVETYYYNHLSKNPVNTAIFLVGQVIFFVPASYF